MIARLRALLNSGEAVTVPGAWDPVTAAMAVQAGHAAVHLSGAVCAATSLGLPDLGYVHWTHIAERAATLLPALNGTPLLADADTGYGDALQAIWTAQRYQAAGIAGLHIEDQIQPKRCGHLAGKELDTMGRATAKVRAIAAETDIVVVARTDAFSVAGIDETLRRASSYLDAGADAVFPEGVTSPQDLARFDGMPLVVNMSEAGVPWPGITTAELSTLGVRLVLRPTTAWLAALFAVRESYAAQGVPTMPWPDFTDLLRQPAALELGGKYAA
jgi:2-methylisocitrate lyase-like PEP mutase family enzyme